MPSKRAKGEHVRYASPSAGCDSRACPPHAACRPDDYEKAKGKYIINTETMKQLKKDAIVMHPLPRVDEVGGGFGAGVGDAGSAQPSDYPACRTCPAAGATDVALLVIRAVGRLQRRAGQGAGPADVPHGPPLFPCCRLTDSPRPPRPPP